MDMHQWFYLFKDNYNNPELLTQFHDWILDNEEQLKLEKPDINIECVINIIDYMLTDPQPEEIITMRIKMWAYNNCPESILIRIYDELDKFGDNALSMCKNKKAYKVVHQTAVIKTMAHELKIVI